MQLDVPNLPDVVGVRFAYIPDYPGYCINDHGDVYSCKNARWGYRNKWEPLKEGTSSSGYPTVNLTRKGFPPRTRPTCVLVMLSFAGPRPLKMDCCHENGVRTDSRLCNLRWDTRKGNVSDTDRHGTKIQGERSPMAVLTESAVREMRSKYRKGLYGYKRLAKEYGVNELTVYAVINRQTWKHVA